MKLLEAERGLQRLIKKLEELARWAGEFCTRDDDDFCTILAYEIALTPTALYGYGSVFNPFVRLFQDREVNDIDLILVTEEMNRFQQERHKWCSDDKWRRERPCISCAENRMLQRLSWFIDRYLNPNKLEGPSLKIAIGNVERDEDVASGLIRKEQLVLLWKQPEPTTHVGPEGRLSFPLQTLDVSY